MPKKKIFITAAAVALVILILLALALQGQPKGFVLGLLFIIGFVGLFGGLILFINFLNERYLVRPRNPTHLCEHCYSLYQDPEEFVCQYCLGTFGLEKPLHPLDNFLQQHDSQDILARIEVLQTDLKKARGRNILFIEHDIKNLKRILRIEQVASKETGR